MSQKQESYSIDSSAVVAGLASGLITFCKTPNHNFLSCKAKSENPESCLNEAIEARRCAFTLANEYLNPAYGCDKLFTQYTKCLRDREFNFKDCYGTRLAFEACAAEKIGVEFRDPVNPQL